ncbi:MAG: HAD family hydrolase [Peptostreptococcaceae bacterium]
MIKLIASDMDGTLLNSEKNLNPEFHSLLKKLKSKGIIFAAVSGRDMNSLKRVFKDIDEDIILASNNGNFITYKGEVIFNNSIEKNKLGKIQKIIRKTAKHSTIYCGREKIYSESFIPAIMGRRYKLKVDVVKDITNIKDDIIKVTTIGNKSRLEKSLKELENLKKELMITMSGPQCFDICKLGGTKEQGIKILQDKFSINFDETMVFGDHLNDLEMMQSAYYSFAMENAKDEVKQKARFIAKTNDENGVVDAIKKVVFENEATVV